jgi:microcystin-dependent protein
MSKTNVLLWRKVPVVQQTDNTIKPNTAYSVGDIVFSDSLTDLYLRCTTAGTTGDTEPTWTDGTGAVTWGTAAFILDSDMLKAYPVGCFFESTVSTSPHLLFGGVWEQDTSGRVLIASNGTYTAGSTGGSATQALTVAQLPVFTPSGSISSVGDHNHISKIYNVNNSSYTMPMSAIRLSSGYSWVNSGNTTAGGTGGDPCGITSDSGGHGHTFTGNSIGSGSAHNNMQPYLSVYRWHRLS